jgi:hypothetical protein
LKGTRHIVVWALGLLTALNLSATAQAAPVSVRIVPLFDPAAYAGRGAVGLMVPGVGATITRAGALASLERGKTQHALLGGRPHGKVIVRPSAAPGSDVTFYVSLPPPGRTANHMRYPVAIVGCGARGLLTSSSTRLDGLISIADIAPAVERLRHHQCDLSPLGTKRTDAAAAQLRTLDRRIRHVHDARGWALVAVIVTVLALSVLGPPGVVGCVAAVGASLLLSAIGVEGFWPLVLGIAGLTAAFALLLPLRRFVPFVVSVFLLAFLFVLVFDTRLNSLAVLGARPDGGGRFYGVTNQLETLLLAPVIAAAATRRRGLFVGVGLLALVVVGWSKAGADGGGLVVYATALAVLALRLRTEPLTARRLALACAGVVVLTFALVGIDAALGGSSHVTHAVGKGPGALVGDLGGRLHISWATLTSRWLPGLVFLAAVAALAMLASRPPRTALCEALVAGIVVSLLVNDTPNDVAAAGALSYAVVWAWERVRAAPVRATRLDSTADAPPGSGSDGRRLRAAARRLRRGADRVAGAADG